MAETDITMTKAASLWVAMFVVFRFIGSLDHIVLGARDIFALVALYPRHLSGYKGFCLGLDGLQRYSIDVYYTQNNGS